MGFCADIRTSCAEVAAGAAHVRIDREALERAEYAPVPSGPALDPARHYLEGTPEAVAAFTLTLDAINFGSGWFPTLRKRRGPDGAPLSGYFTVATGLTERFRAAGPWSPAELRAMRATTIAEVLGQRADHELMALYAQALRELGRFLGSRAVLDVIAGADGSAEQLAQTLGTSMALWSDPGFYKRAQIVPSDLALAGVATFGDLDRLTIFADNLVPHVLRCDGILVYDAALAAHVDEGRTLSAGRAEREIRACAVHACELLAGRLGVSERELDHLLWNRGQAPAYKARPRHRTRCVFY